MSNNDTVDYLASLVLQFCHELGYYSSSSADKDFAARAALAFSDRLIAAALDDTSIRQSLIGPEAIRAWMAERQAAEDRIARQIEEKKAKARAYVQKHRQKHIPTPDQ